VDLREHGGHALRRRRRRGQEAQIVAVLLLIRAVGDEAMQVYIKAEVAAEALDDSDHARVQGRDRGQAVLLLHAAPHVMHHRPRQPPGDGRQQRRVVAQPHRHRARERQHPLPVTHRRQYVVHQQRQQVRTKPSSKSPQPAKPSSSPFTNAGSGPARSSQRSRNSARWRRTSTAASHSWV
jgi:hypothetical protein